LFSIAITHLCTSGGADEKVERTTKVELNTASVVAEGENDVDEETRFQENDIDHSIQQKALVASGGISAGIGLALSPSTSAAATAVTNSEGLMKLDNDEALKRIQSQLNEMKILTSTSSSAKASGSAVGSSGSSSSSSSSGSSSSSSSKTVSTINVVNTDEEEELINVCANIQPIQSESSKTATNIANGVFDKIKKISKIRSNFYEFVSKRARL